MSLIATNTGNGEFEMVPEGTYVGRCYKIIDLGTQTTTGQYGTNSQHKIMVSWELLDKDVKMEDGRPFAVSQWYTLSLNEKANLRGDLEAWRGKKFTDDELSGFDLHDILGAYCMLQVIHSTDGKYANVNAIMSFKGDKPEAINENVIFDIDNPDLKVFDAMSDNMKQKIQSAPEWGSKDKLRAEPLPDPIITDVDDEIDLKDIPF